LVHRLVNHDDQQLLAHAMASDFNLLFKIYFLTFILKFDMIPALSSRISMYT
jgi:hypothetical protein